jgi:hypothetical protein
MTELGRTYWCSASMSALNCKIIAHASTRHAATYHVQAGSRAYKVRVEDFPGEDCTVRIDDVEKGSELFRSIEAVVRKDWLGIDDTPPRV